MNIPIERTSVSLVMVGNIVIDEGSIRIKEGFKFLVLSEIRVEYPYSLLILWFHENHFELVKFFFS